MRNSYRTAVAALAGWLSLTAAAFAQPAPQIRRPVVVPVQTPPIAPPVNVTPASGLTAKGLLGAAVNLAGNAAVGTVDDLVFDAGGALEYLVVRTGNRFVLVPWEALVFNADQRIALLNITAERFRDVPVFAASNWPNFTEPGYRERLYTLYGLRAEPRLERRDSLRR